MYPVWALLTDGPLAGMVLELKMTDRELQVKTDADGVCLYRRYSKAQNAKIFLFKFSKSLVI